jgi:hypothetical protein
VSRINFFNKNFLLLSGNNIMLSTISTFIIIILVVNQQYIFASKFSIISSILIVILKILSVNLRNILIAKKDKFSLEKFIFFRITFSIIIFLLSIFIFDFFNFSKNTFYYYLILIILVNWCNEVALVKIEINKNYILSNLLFYSNSIILLLILSFSLLSSFIYIKYFLVVFLLFNLVFLLINTNNQSFNFLNFFTKDIINILNSSFNSLSFLSSLTLNLANLIWRISIIYLIGDKLASIIIVFFALGSFPGSIFVSSFGPTMVKKKVKPIILSKIFIIYFIMLSLIAFYFTKNFDTDIELLFSVNFILLIYIFSLFGSLIMLLALYDREKYINKNPSFNNEIFKKDIIIAILISTLPYLLFNLGGIFFLSLTYMLGSIISLLIYKNEK